MKSFLTLAALAPLALAVPVELEKRQNIDTTVLQFALTLEHLENVFYKGALKTFSQEQFAAAGYGPNYYNSLKYIASDEESHTKFLSAALTAAGVTPNAACTYKFPYTDVKSFITLSTVLEGVGTSAYLGGAPLITNKDYLTAAGSILVAEALHTSLQRNAIKALPNANPYGTPLSPSPVYTLAAAFIVSCPASNAPLPFTAFPSLTVDNPSGYCEQPDCSPVKLAKREAEADAEANNWQNWQTTTTTTTPCPTSTKAPVKTTTMAANPTPKPLTSPPAAGAVVSFTAAKAVPAGSYLTFISGLQITSVAGTINGMKISAAIPAGISGQSYVLVTKSAITGKLADDQILFGPAILEVYPAPPMIDYGYSK